MPSRRRFLASSLSLGLAASLAGCLTDLGLAKTGYLHVKVVDVAWQHRGRQWQDEILWAVSDGRSHLDFRVASEYEEIVESPTDVRVAEELEQQLLGDFSEVVYVTGFCWPDSGRLTCRNPQASRETFNRVQFDDEAEFVFDSPGVHVVDVYEGVRGDPTEWEIEYETFDFGEMHAENGVPI